MKNLFYSFGMLVLLGTFFCKNKAEEKPMTENKVEGENKPNENAIKENDKISFTGLVLGYQTEHSACFFVDQEMIKHETAKALGKEAESGVCTNPKYGKGVPVVFYELDKNSDYPNPPKEDILIIITGYWKTENYQGRENVAVFHVTEYEPFF